MYKRQYLHALIRYNRALSQRNALLKASAGRELDREALEIWDEQLIECGQEVQQKRLDFLEDFKEVFREYYEPVSYTHLFRFVFEKASHNLVKNVSNPNEK